MPCDGVVGAVELLVVVVVVRGCFVAFGWFDEGVGSLCWICCRWWWSLDFAGVRLWVVVVVPLDWCCRLFGCRVLMIGLLVVGVLTVFGWIGIWVDGGLLLIDRIDWRSRIVIDGLCRGA